MVIGEGSKNSLLSIRQVQAICRKAFDNSVWQNKKILAIIPDHTRTAPIDLMFRTVYDILIGQGNQLDFLVALGTHPPMSESAILNRIGISKEEKSTIYDQCRLFNHHWNDPDQLTSVGKISSEKVSELSDGMMTDPVDVTINKMVLDYDQLLIIGPTFPHEVVGFSGGDKYLFPGIAGKEIIDMFHWLGALISNPRIIGKKHTPVRKVVEIAAEMVPVARYCLSLVVSGTELCGLYFGDSREAWSAAADLSDQVHIIYKEHPFKKVLSRAPQMYDDLWTGGKCMYKLEPVVADGGELIIYAPHINEVSVTHGELIESIGYHTRDYFIKQWNKFGQVSGGVMAHSTHVKGIGSFENGKELPRITVTLATGIPEHTCRKINLGYMNPQSIDISEWQDREDEGLLYVPKAGEMLYRLKNDPFV